MTPHTLLVALAATAASFACACGPLPTPSPARAGTFVLAAVGASAAAQPGTAGGRAAEPVAGPGESAPPTPGPQGAGSAEERVLPTGASPTPLPASASPRVSGGGGSGGGAGGGAATAADGVTGTVLAAGASVAMPIAGVAITLSDGRSTTTASDGSFSFAGARPADGLYHLVHAAYLPSTIVGLTGTGLTLHLRPRGDQGGSEAPPASIPLLVSGTVLDASGLPVEDALVVARDGQGSEGDPCQTGPDGRFQMTIHTPAGAFTRGSFLAWDVSGGNQLGQALEVTLGVGDPGPTIQLAPASHRIVRQIDAGAAPGQLTTTVTVAGPHGEALTLGADGAELRLTPLAEARFSAEVVARDNENRTVSVWHQHELRLATDGAATELTGALLAPPQLVPIAGLAPGVSLAWGAVSGAAGYHVALTPLGGQASAWEAYTSTPGIAFAAPGTLGVGNYGLHLTAWDLPGMGARQVASLRALRILPDPAASDFRRATRVIVTSRAP